MLGKGVDERGFHAVWVPEHVVLFDDPKSQYPYSDDGKVPMGPSNGLLEPFDTMAFLAAVTEKVRLGTGICVVPQRNPVYTAKDVATLDWLSNGRIDFGIGVGWLAEEFEALAVPFERRGRRTREYIEAMKSLWQDSLSSYDGELYKLPECRQNPKPVQTPHPPIHIGGHSDAAMRRVANWGQGWYGNHLTPEEVAERLAYLERLLEGGERSLAEIEVSLCPYMLPCDLDTVKRYRDAGVDQIILMLMSMGTDDLTMVLDALAEEFLEPARSL